MRRREEALGPKAQDLNTWQKKPYGRLVWGFRSWRLRVTDFRVAEGLRISDLRRFGLESGIWWDATRI